MTDNPHAPPTSQSDEALINVGPINRIPGSDSISCPGLPSGMMCFGWGEQGWAINDKDGKRIAAGNWGDRATLPASQSEALVTQADREVYAQVLTELGIGRWAEDARNGVDDCDAPLALIAQHRAAAEAKGKREGIEEAAKGDSYAAWQQKRGMLADTVDWAVLEYDEFMKDDAYDAQRVLDRIIERLRSTRSALAEKQP